MTEEAPTSGSLEGSFLRPIVQAPVWRKAGGLTAI